MPIEDYIRMDVEVLVVRDKAICVDTEDEHNVWIPRACLKDDIDTVGKNIEIAVAKNWWNKRDQ